MSQNCSTCYDYSPIINVEVNESLVEYGRFSNMVSVNDTKESYVASGCVSTTEKWNELNDFMVSEGNQSEVVLRSNTGWDNNENGTDTYGFDAQTS